MTTRPITATICEICGANPLEDSRVVLLRHNAIGKIPAVWRCLIHAEPMTFQVGRFYRHTTGEDLHILAVITTTLWGETLLAETNRATLIPVGKDHSSTINYHEISPEAWMTNFS